MPRGKRVSSNHKKEYKKRVSQNRVKMAQAANRTKWKANTQKQERERTCLERE